MQIAISIFFGLAAFIAVWSLLDSGVRMYYAHKRIRAQLERIKNGEL